MPVFTRGNHKKSGFDGFAFFGDQRGGDQRGGDQRGGLPAAGEGDGSDVIGHAATACNYHDSVACPGFLGVGYLEFRA
jgi:hypothetical protein